METVTVIGALLGGLGLVLLGIGLLGDGLPRAVHVRLRSLLAQWADPPLRGLATGLASTAALQSSSAQLAAVIGAVNSNLLSQRRAQAVVYGAIAGSAFTAWLVLLVGGMTHSPGLAWLLIGIGMLLRVGRPDRRIAAAGLAL